MMNSNTQKLHELGQSLWLDNINREIWMAAVRYAAVARPNRLNAGVRPILLKNSFAARVLSALEKVDPLERAQSHAN